MQDSIYTELAAACEKAERFVLGIISSVKGSTPQKQGAKALFFEDGRIVGTLGGGCLEAEVRKRAFEQLRDQQPTRFDLVLDHDFGWDDGLICGGKVSCILLPNAREAVSIWREVAPRQRTATWGVRPDFSIAVVERQSDSYSGTASDWIYRETVMPPEELWIAGAGHVAQAIAPLAEQMDFRVTVFDDRPELANSVRFPASTRLRVDYWEKLLVDDPPGFSKPASGIIVTRGHQHDALVLSKWIHKPFAFLGMIGSKRKKSIIFTHFIQEGLARREQLNQVACPVGLPLGGGSVPEIALSVVAQLVQNRSERRALREAARIISPKHSLTSPVRR
jgi:xanthine dehydrogenase accessory factor